MSPSPGSPPSPHLSPLTPLLCPSPPGTAGSATKKETGSPEKNCPSPLEPGGERLSQVLGLFLQSHSPTVPPMKGLSSQEPLQTGGWFPRSPPGGPFRLHLVCPGSTAAGAGPTSALLQAGFTVRSRQQIKAITSCRMLGSRPPNGWSQETKLKTNDLQFPCQKGFFSSGLWWDGRAFG